MRRSPMERRAINGLFAHSCARVEAGNPSRSGDRPALTNGFLKTALAKIEAQSGVRVA